jgi:hypothetical protein
MALVGCPNCPGEDINVLLCDDNAAQWRRLCSCERAKRRRCTRCVRDAECVVFRNYGPGTLYRHFPTREDLIEAVYRSEVEKLAAAGG